MKENYQSDRSLLILKMHHTMADGYGVAAFLANVMDTHNDDPRVLPSLKNFSFLETFMIYLSVPYHILLILLRSLSFPKNVNPFTTNHPECSGVKEGAFAKEYSVTQIKMKCKEQGVTVNDLIMTAVSMTCKQYFLRKGDEKTNRILLTMPVSYRLQQHRKEDFEFKNNVSVIPVPVELSTDFKHGVQLMSKALKPLRTSFMAIGQMYLTKLGLYFPF